MKIALEPSPKRYYLNPRENNVKEDESKYFYKIHFKSNMPYTSII